MKFSQEEKQKIKNLLIGARISSGRLSYNTGARILDRVGVIEDLYLKEYPSKTEPGKTIAKWTIRTDFSELPFKDFCSYIVGGVKYKTQSNKIKDLAKTYCKSIRENNDKLFHDFLENLDDGKFNIQDVVIEDDEVAWLEKHVTNIIARFPKKYERNFKQSFPDAEYTLAPSTTWNYGFTMYFDDLTNVPESLLTVKNNNGNTLDFDKKLMRNTSYIWKLVKTHPQFSFGRRVLSK